MCSIGSLRALPSHAMTESIVAPAVASVASAAAALAPAVTLTKTLSVTRQCALAGISRATVYAHRKPKVIDQSDLQLSGMIDREYTRHPFYGSRRMVVYLGREGHCVNRKRVQRLMRQIGLARGFVYLVAIIDW